MSQTIPISLRKLLGERSYSRYIEETVIPEIRRLHSTQQITEQEFRKINDQIQRHGLSVLSPDVRVLDCVSLNTASPEGSLLEATLQLTPGVQIHHIVKSFSEAEDFDAAVQNQREVANALQGTEYQDKIPQPNYVNRSRRVMVTPFVEGDTLNHLLQTQDPQEQEQTLQRVIDDYVQFSSRLNESRDKIQFRKGLMDYNDYFQRFYLRKRKNSKVLQAFAENIGNQLNQHRNSICHGDLHRGNVIVNGRIAYIDWPKAAGNGSPELDLAMLIRKSSSDLEGKLIDYATQKLNPNDEEQRTTSRELIEKNLIKQDLVYAQRYLEIAERTKDTAQKQQLYRLSQVLFNTAIHRIKSAESRGLVNSNLLEAILEQPPETSHFRTLRLEDVEYEQLRRESDPYSSMTQEQLQSPQSPLSTRNGLSEADRLEKLVRRDKRNRKIKQASLVLGGLALIGTLGFSVYQYGDFKQEETRKVMAEQNYQLHIQAYYSGTFQEAFEKLKVGILDGKIKTKLPLDSKEIDEIAQSYNIDPELLRNIMRVNRYNAGIGIVQINGYTRINDLNLLDPFSYVETEVAEPLENLRKGVRRLSNLIRENNGDISEAVYRFYDPTYPNDSKYSPGLTWRHGTINREDIETIRTEQFKSAYNALNGLAVEYKGGDSWYYFKQPLKADPQKGASEKDCEQKCDDTYQGQLYSTVYDSRSCVYSCTPKTPQSQAQKDCLERCKGYPQAGPAGGACELGCERF